MKVLHRFLPAVLLSILLLSSCARRISTVELPLALVEQRTDESIILGNSVRKALDEISYEMRSSLDEIPDNAFAETDLELVRFALMSCFTYPLCTEEDGKQRCQTQSERQNSSIETTLLIDGRPPVFGFRPCALPNSPAFEASIQSWDENATEWFRHQVLLVDSLRVRLKALIPDQLQEIESRMDNFRAESRELQGRAEDSWHRAQREMKSPEQRRADEERWELFQQKVVLLEESLVLIQLDVDRLRQHHEQDLRQVAARIATLGTSAM